MTNCRVVWVSTSLETRGGIASVVRTMRDTPLWTLWSARHVATHRDGSAPARSVAFVTGTVRFIVGVLADRPSLVHIHTASYGSFARKYVIAKICRLLGIPVILHVHGGEFRRFHDRSPRMLQRLIERTLTDAAIVVALGDVWKRRLEEIAPGARIEVVPNAVRSGEPVHQPSVGEPVHVLFLGRISDDKGAFVLLDAWAKVRAELGDAGGMILTLAGDGELARARARIAELGLTDITDLRGWVPSDQVPELIGSAQVLVLPSRFECQPMAVLEAMARGLCIVATEVGGIPDLVDAQSGILVPADRVDALAGALRTAVVDGDARIRMGRSAHDRIESGFDVDIVWRRFDALYREVAS